ncbi:M16 family metallopeptidase [Altererythrobacter sp. Root672]|uniref:M16 family metallopeptidase n=1 Tax=Altererythrobacter sp. Root672 TaxID=1736584 RepID=UPI0006F9E22E|nr:M16 family metallopeptidase [Altererythrobacter sp. Root672]KRA83899.1 peptidase M16 [Altererythrobacter sp. Root672]
MIRRSLFAAFLLATSVPALAQPAPVAPEHEWPFEKSDLPADPAYRFGRLDNGMRYIIRSNGTPAGQAMVQFWINSGSVAETEQERGYAHFIEHMSFNGSTRIPEGEMVKLLEREGLAFGPDTNASTSFDTTLYMLNLPRNDPALLDTALMLMRETASELTFNPEAVEREKGVVLSERRVRDTYDYRDTIDGLEFFYPGARFVDRMPIGTFETLQAATPEKLRELYQRIYRPENTAIIVVGDFDADKVEAEIREHFASWQPASIIPETDPGPIPFDLAGQTDIYLDPALSEQITISRHGPAPDRTDTRAFREKNVRRQLGYGIINRRLQRLARAENPPFRSAGVGTAEMFDAGRTSNLVIYAGEGEWRGALAAAQAEYRRALEFGFTEAEVAEQIANLRTSLENNVAGASTRSNANFITGAITLLEDNQIPTTPDSALERFLGHLPEITPDSVLAALKEEFVPLDNPLIRFEGRTAPEGGAEALRAAWNEGMAVQLAAEDSVGLEAWGYTDFGTPGTVVSDTAEPLLGIRTLVFSNGLRLNLKKTELQRDRISVQLNVDGGQMLNTREDPIATAMSSSLPIGGLGKHSTDELQSILAGRSVSFNLGTTDDTFVLNAGTTPRDLEVQLQVLAAAISDPGYRPQGESQYRRNIKAFFASRNATPESALANALGEIVSDGDPRFTLQPQDAYLGLSFARLRDEIADRLNHGALELAVVGDFDEGQTIDMVSRTLGALPQREADFRAYTDNRTRMFTTDRAPRVVRHEGAADQAIVRMSWPTRDDSDFAEVLKLDLLDRVMRIELTDKLREELGKTYSPGVSASESDTYTGYGTFNIAASVDVKEVDATRAAILETVRSLIDQPVDDDALLRARQPLLEAYDNALKTNAGWMNLAYRAQSKAERIERFTTGKDRLAALTPADVQEMAAKYLQPDKRLEIIVLPKEGS